MELRIDGQKRKKKRRTGRLINVSLIKSGSQGTSLHFLIYPGPNTHELGHDSLQRHLRITSRTAIKSATAKIRAGNVNRTCGASLVAKCP